MLPIIPIRHPMYSLNHPPTREKSAPAPQKPLGTLKRPRRIPIEIAQWLTFIATGIVISYIAERLHQAEAALTVEAERVAFDDAASPWYTLCEVRSPDRRGLPCLGHGPGSQGRRRSAAGKTQVGGRDWRWGDDGRDGL